MSKPDSAQWQPGLLRSYCAKHPMRPSLLNGYLARLPNPNRLPSYTGQPRHQIPIIECSGYHEENAANRHLYQSDCGARPRREPRKARCGVVTPIEEALRRPKCRDDQLRLTLPGLMQVCVRPLRHPAIVVREGKARKSPLGKQHSRFITLSTLPCRYHPVSGQGRLSLPDAFQSDTALSLVQRFVIPLSCWQRRLAKRHRYRGSGVPSRCQFAQRPAIGATAVPREHQSRNIGVNIHHQFIAVGQLVRR